MDNRDFGFYGKGLDGYVHYKQSVDRIEKSSGSSSPRHGRDDGAQAPGVYALKGWQAAVLLLLCGGVFLFLFHSAV